MRRRHVLPFGAEITPRGVQFRLWAPDAAAVSLQLDQGPEITMAAEGAGWLALTTTRARAGSLYLYRTGAACCPDPAARSQPDGVFGPSEVVDPVAECPGRSNWGCDRVLPFEPASRYGSSAGLKSLIDACHARGVGVILDVVDNHFGPEGNSLPAYARAFFAGRHRTPWPRRPSSAQSSTGRRPQNRTMPRCWRSVAI
jgi:maltooligosyltrehalose trehalohydrolase